MQLNPRKTEDLIRQQKDAKHRMYVLDQWLKTQITYNQDVKASIEIIKPKMILYKLIDQSKANKLFPYFQEILKMSDAMVEIISSFKRQTIIEIMIGQKLNKIVSYYKIYLEYFKQKTQIKALYEELEKNWPKELRSIETDLRNYFEKLYLDKAVTKSKLVQQNMDNNKNITNPKANITIHDCLERPLYRLFKYHLLIDSYLKKLSLKHPDYVPLKRAKQLFVEIGQKCNNSFTEQQNEDLKYKLEVLYGQSIPNSTKYKTMMTADSLYFPCKLYIFNNLIIISKTQKMIGFRQQKLYLKLGIDEFSFISYKKDFKYFKNVLILCGIYDCLHLILPDKGTRLEIYKLVSKIMQEQKFKAFQKRQHPMVQQSAKIPWMVQKMEQSTSWLTGAKFQVIDIEVRDLGMFSSDTVFIMSVSIPEYIDDEATFLKTSKFRPESTYQDNSGQNNYEKMIQIGERESLTKEEIAITSKIGPVQFKNFESESQFVKTSNYSPISQQLEIHLDDLLAIHKDLRQRFPEVKLPEIDPLSKDFNFYTENKKKTKTFQVRSFLIEQFFNYVFRHPMIMLNPISIVKKIKIDQFMWNYIKNRSDYLQNDKRDEKLVYGQTHGNKYDQNHCSLCQQSVLQKISKFQELRQRTVKLSKQKQQNYCFNFYNLLRNNFLGLPFSQFNTVERMLFYLQYFEGRLDYAFVYKKNLAKVHKIISVNVPKLLPSEQRNSLDPIFHTVLEVAVDQKTTVGMVINSITNDAGLLNMFDFRLMIVFNGLERILDQDEYLYDIINTYEVKWEEKKVPQSQIEFVGPRNSYRESIMQTTMGMFSYIKNFLPTINKNESALYLKKLVYFPIYFELESVRVNFQRSKIIVAEILYKIHKFQSTISSQIWGQVCGLYYCLLTSKELISTKASIKTDSHSVFKICLDLLPEEMRENIKLAKIFEQKVQGTINQRKKYITSLNNQTESNFMSSIHQRIIQIGYKYFMVNTYFTPVDAKRVPNILVLNQKLLLSGNCYIGVNHSKIIVIRDKKNITETIHMRLEDVEIVHSVYSIFISYRMQKPRKQVENKQDQKIDEYELRFDSKTLHGFVQLCQNFKLMKNKFGPLLMQYDSI